MNFPNLNEVLPFIGRLVAPSVSVAMLESAGWLLAEDLAAERDKKIKLKNRPRTAGTTSNTIKSLNFPNLNEVW
ncbi:MAG: hypothetical protein II857_10255, partial [Selenomonadaceae bacterium]|nr:hypothetical protein [Selenomonadaceae bacterium]